mgnify:CR=1 FL=1
MSEYHEAWSALPEQSRDLHRALKSLIEELEAIDWYQQREALTEDESLKQILEHNRDEEVEHAAMTLEWLRRKLPVFDEQLRQYLFSSGPITEIEAGGAEASGGGSKGLGIGDMKEKA